MSVTNCWKAVLLCLCVIAIVGCRQGPGNEPNDEMITVRVGHVGHDHHTALYVALDNAAEYADKSGISVKVIEDRKLYELYDQGKKVANLEIVKVGGGSLMPTALAQEVIEVGLGGVPCVLAAIDNEMPIKLISPLHYKGNMLVVRPDFSAQTWDEFVAAAKAAEEPLRIGYKSPMAVAKVVFEEALRHEGLVFGGDASVEGLQIQMVNVKGGSKLNVALGGGLIDGYVGNNPFPAIAVDQKTGRILCDLEELPPGLFRDHPCCCVAARSDILGPKRRAVECLLVLLIQATETMNNDLDKAVAAAVRWTGTSETVERMSIPTSGYSMEPSERWAGTTAKWVESMNALGLFEGTFKGKTSEEVAGASYDFSLLETARSTLEQRSHP